MTLRQKMTDAEIDAAIASDPDWAEFEPIDWSKAEVVVPPKKQAISIKTSSTISRRRVPAISGASTPRRAAM
jgi:hypothetical protein